MGEGGRLDEEGDFAGGVAGEGGDFIVLFECAGFCGVEEASFLRESGTAAAWGSDRGGEGRCGGR